MFIHANLRFLDFYEVNFVLLNSKKLAYVSQHSNVHRYIQICYYKILTYI